MADVQIEHGFVRVATTLYEALMRVRMPGRHKDVVHAMIRLTYGFNRTEDRIAASQVAGLLDEEAGNVRRMMRDLVSWGVLAERNGGHGRTATWRVVKDFDTWNVGRTSTAERMARVGKTRVEPHTGVGTPQVLPHPCIATPEGRVEPHPGTRVLPHPHQRQKTVNKDKELGDAPSVLASSDRKPRCVRPPESLSAEQYADVRDWCERKRPDQLHRLEEHIEACLGWHRAAPPRQWKVDYAEACKGWIRRERMPTSSKAAKGRAAIGDLDDWRWAMEENK